MKRLITNGILVLAAAMLPGACIYQHPADGGTDPTFVEVTATITIDNAYGTTAMQDKARAREVARGEDSRQTRRVIVDAYRQGERERVSRQVFTAGVNGGDEARLVIPITLQLRALDYTLVTWCDYPAEGTADDDLYNTADLREVTCTEPYPGGSPRRQCARGTTNIDLTPFRDRWGSTTTADITMTTPLAQWRLVTKDVRLFLEKTAAERAAGRTYSVRLSYGFYLPVGVDAMTGMPGNSLAGVTFTLPLDLPTDGSGEAEIGGDHLFAGDDASFAVVSIEIIDDTGKVVSRVRGLKIPYERGKLTTARGTFLTSETEGGVNIDTDYEGDVEVDLDDLN